MRELKPRKKKLIEYLEKYPEGRKTKNQYKIMTLVTKKLFPELESIDNKRLAVIVKELAHMPRDWRELTEGHDRENKKRLADDWKAENGYVPNPNQNLFEHNMASN